MNKWFYGELTIEKRQNGIEMGARNVEFVPGHSDDNAVHLKQQPKELEEV